MDEGPSVENVSYLRRLGVTRVKPYAHLDSKIPKNTSIGGVRYEFWQFKWGVA